MIDFGLSSTTSFAESNVGNPDYSAPEIGKAPLYGQKADIFSVGAVLYELLTTKRYYVG